MLGASREREKKRNDNKTDSRFAGSSCSFPGILAFDYILPEKVLCFYFCRSRLSLGVIPLSLTPIFSEQEI